MNFRINLYCPAFGYLQHRSKTFNQVQSHHSYGHTSFRKEIRRETSSTEIITISGVPSSSFQTFLNLSFRNLPTRFHGRFSIGIRLLPCSVKGCCSRINQMNNTISSHTCQFLTRNTFHSLRTPISTYIRENLCTIRQQMTEQHSYTITSIILSGHYICFTNTIPVE